MRGLVLICVAWSSGAFASNGRLSWDEVAAIVRGESLELQRERARLAVAESERFFAEASPNPTLDVGVLVHVAGANTFDTSQPSLGISQPIRVVAKAEARRRAAAANLALARAEVDTFERELLFEARRRFVDLQVAEARLVELEGVVAEVSGVETIVTERRKAGVASDFDVHKVRREVVSMRLERDAAALEVDVASAMLAQLLGRAEWSPSAVPLEASGVVGERIVRHPELVRAERELEARRSSARLVDRERWPDLVVSGGVTMTTDAWGVAPYVGVSIDLMAFDRQRAELERSRAEVVVAQREVEAAERRVATRVALARREVERRRAALASWDEAMGRGLSAQARDAYAAGQVDLLDVLDAVRADGDARLRRVELLGEVVRAEVGVMYAVGD